MSSRVPGLVTLSVLAVPVLAASLLAACSSVFSGANMRNPDTATGNYLAARYAGSLREMDAANFYFGKALASDPQNSALQERGLFLAITAGKMGKATGLAQALMQTEPGNRTARLVLALQALKAGQYKNALAHTQGAESGPFTILVSALLKAWTHAATGNRQEAYAALDVLRGQYGFTLFDDYHKGLLAVDGGDTKTAVTAFRSALAKSNGTHVRVVDAYGRMLEKRGERQKARAIYESYLVHAPDDPLIRRALARVKQAGGVHEPPAMLVETPTDGVAEALYGLGRALAQERSLDAATLYLRLALYMRPDLDVARVLLADLYEQTGLGQQAIDNYGKVPPRSALRPGVDIQIAYSLDRMGHTRKALAHLRDIVDAGTESQDPVIAMGDILRSHERYQEAVAEYTQVIEKIVTPESHHWPVYYARGVCYERTRNWPAAEADLKRALKLSDGHPLVQNYLGYSWIEQNTHLQEAIVMIRSAVEQRPHDGYIIDSLGWAHYRLGEFEQAVRHLERAVELRPDDPVINNHLGDAFWRVGRRLEARFQWRHVLALKPEEKLVREIGKKLQFGLDDVPA